MRIPWRFIPELENLPPVERSRLWREARRDPFTPWDAVLAVGIFVFMILYGLMGLWVLHHTHLAWLSALVYIIWWFAGWEIVQAVLIQRYRPCLRRLLGSGG